MGTTQSQDALVSDRYWTQDRPGGGGPRAPGHKMASNGYHGSGKMDGSNKKSKAKPSPPQRPRINHVTNETVSLSWNPPRQFGASQTILAYTVEVCNVSDRHWSVLTKTCQSSSYEARYLEPSTEYMFRIRAENLFGVGKPSVPSESVTTKEYDTATDMTIGMSQPVESTIIHASNPNRDTDQEKSITPGASSLQRRHSFSVHLDGRVSSILKDSDSVLNKSTPAPTLQRNRSGSERAQTLTRSNFSRTSLPSSRKVSLPIILPGTGNNSVIRLRESRNSLKWSHSDNLILASTKDSTKSKLRESRSSLGSSVSDVNSSLAPSDDVKKRDSQGSLRSSTSDVTLSRDGASSENSRDEGLYDCSTGSYSKTPCNNNNNVDKPYEQRNNELNSEMRQSENPIQDKLTAINEGADEISQLKENLKNLELTEEKLKFHDLNNRLRISDSSFSQSDAQKNYYESLENPWEREDTTTDPQRIMAAPFCDDIKMALYAKTVHEDYSACLTNHSFEEEKEGGDFRTLQRVLQSSSMIVRASRTSAVDIVGVVYEDDGQAHVMRRGPLSTILDEEEEDPVRVTTL